MYTIQHFLPILLSIASYFVHDAKSTKMSPANNTIGSFSITTIVAMVFFSDNGDEGEKEFLDDQLVLNDGNNGQDDNDDVGGINSCL